MDDETIIPLRRVAFRLSCASCGPPWQDGMWSVPWDQTIHFLLLSNHTEFKSKVNERTRVKAERTPSPNIPDISLELPNDKG